MRDGMIMGVIFELAFYYYGMYDSICRKATLKCLTKAREEDYKIHER